MGRHQPSPLRLSLLLALAVLAPPAARANGFALDIQGLTSNGTASAGAAAARDPAGQFANPAVLTALDGTQVVAGGMVIAARTPYRDGGSRLLGGAAALPGTDADGAETGLAPWVFASHRLGPDLAVGFALTAPFGTSMDYGRGGGFYGRYQGVESVIESLAFGPSVAWRPVPWLSIGAAAAARRDRAVIGQAFDLGSICVANQTDPNVDPVAACTAAGLAPGQADGYGRFTADGWGYTLTGGLLLEPAQGTTVGLAYRSESRSTVKGREAFDEAVVGVLGPTLAGEPRARLKLPLPDFATLSGAHQLGPVQLLAAVQYTLWDRFDTLRLQPDVPGTGLAIAAKQGFRNAVRVSAGAVWTVRPGMDLFGGAAFEQSPITTRYRQATLPERDSAIAGLGAQAAFGPGLTLGAAYQRVQMLGRSRIDQAGATGDRLVGSVRGSADLAILQLGWRG